MSKDGDTGTGAKPTDLISTQGFHDVQDFKTKVRTWTVRDRAPEKIQRQVDFATRAAFQLLDPAAATAQQNAKAIQAEQRLEDGG